MSFLNYNRQEGFQLANEDLLMPQTHNIFDISAPVSNHFNSTLPAINSSMRYDPDYDSYTVPSNNSRSRSRSRGGVGPTRSTRSNSRHPVSSTSPPPSRPQAIVIPGNNRNPWFVPSPSEYSLPTPDSLHSPIHMQQQYSSFTHSLGGNVLPPVSSLSLHPSLNSGHPHLLSASVPTHTHHHHHAHPHHHLPSPIIDHSIDKHPDKHEKLPPNSAGDKQTLLANEKRRRRRESHNAVERRRRDNINEKISELATLIPECMLDVGVAGESRICSLSLLECGVHGAL